MPYKDIEKRRQAARESAKRYYHRDRLKHLAMQKKWRNELRHKVISYYSNGLNCCACCGETIDEFLTVDHLNNNGSKERKLYTNGGHHNYRFIIKNNYPPGYVIHCYNCNCGRARRLDKICPHKINEKN